MNKKNIYIIIMSGFREEINKIQYDKSLTSLEKQYKIDLFNYISKALNYWKNNQNERKKFSGNNFSRDPSFIITTVIIPAIKWGPYNFTRAYRGLDALRLGLSEEDFNDFAYKLDFLTDKEHPKYIPDAPEAPSIMGKYLSYLEEKKIRENKKNNKDEWDIEFEEYRPRRLERISKKNYSGKRKSKKRSSSKKNRKCHIRKSYTRRSRSRSGKIKRIRVKSSRICKKKK